MRESLRDLSESAGKSSGGTRLQGTSIGTLAQPRDLSSLGFRIPTCSLTLRFDGLNSRFGAATRLVQFPAEAPHRRRSECTDRRHSSM